jgi:hypothetical protein
MLLKHVFLTYKGTHVNLICELYKISYKPLKENFVLFLIACTSQNILFVENFVQSIYKIDMRPFTCKKHIFLKACFFNSINKKTCVSHVFKGCMSLLYMSCMKFYTNQFVRNLSLFCSLKDTLLLKVSLLVWNFCQFQLYLHL